MEEKSNQLHLTRGDTHFFQFSLENPDGSPASLEDGDVLYFTVKRNVHYDEYEFQKKITEFEDGVANFIIEPEDTKKMMFGKYVYDLQVTFKGGIVKTIIKPSRLIIGEEVTDD